MDSFLIKNNIKYRLPEAVFFLLCFGLLLFSCNTSSPVDNAANQPVKYDTIFPKYAKGFYLLKPLSGNRLVLVLQNDENSRVYKYYLLDSASYYYSDTTLPVPVSRAVAFSSTHYGFLMPLQKHTVIKGISGKDYLFAQDKQSIQEIGFTENLNYEKIFALKPQIIFGNSLASVSAPYSQKFKQFNIPYFPVSEYQEPSPLAKAEWIKVFGLLTGTLPQADSIFQNIENSYNNLLHEVQQKYAQQESPTVLMSFPYQNTWYVPGGNSFQATFVHDAGGKYIFAENTAKSSFVVDVEQILGKGKNADVWLNVNQVQSKKDIVNENPLFKTFKAFAQNRIYNNDKRKQELANDYWQSGVVNPQRILQDIITILHQPNDTNLYYYRQVK